MTNEKVPSMELNAIIERALRWVRDEIPKVSFKIFVVALEKSTVLRLNAEVVDEEVGMRFGKNYMISIRMPEKEWRLVARDAEKAIIDEQRKRVSLERGIVLYGEEKSEDGEGEANRRVEPEGYRKDPPSD